MTSKQIMRDLARMRKEIARLAKHVPDLTEKHLVEIAATDDEAWRVLQNQPPVRPRLKAQRAAKQIALDVDLPSRRGR